VYAIERSSRVFTGERWNDLDLPAEVQQEGAVRGLEHLHALDRPHRCDDVLEMRGVGGEHGNIAYLRAPFDANQVDRSERCARLADSGGEPGKGARRVVQADAHDRAERRGGVHASTVGARARCGIGTNYGRWS
jgi:hypothetical protein